MSKKSLGEYFGERLENKKGTQTLRLRQLNTDLDDSQGAQLAKALEKTGHQFAGLLERMAGKDLGLVRSYERGYPAAGRASEGARKALGLIDPAYIQKVEKS
jgi:hypothetical protein